MNGQINLAGFSNGSNNNGGDLTPEMILNNAFNQGSSIGGMNMNGNQNNNRQSKTVDYNLYLAGQHLGFIKLHKYLNPEDAQLILNNIVAGMNGQAVFDVKLCGTDTDKRLDLSSLTGFGSNNTPQQANQQANQNINNNPDISGATLSTNTENQQA